MILRWIDNGGYPLEYLLARIRVRRGGLIDQWQPLLAAANPLAAVPHGGPREHPAEATPEGLWKSMLCEFSWVHGQMDDAAREVFTPYFAWFELRTMILSLRNRAARNALKVGELLEFSLLAERLKRILAEEGDLRDAVMALDAARTSLAVPFRGLEKVLREGGLSGLEQSLTDSWLAAQAPAGLHPFMAGFVGCLIDLRNLLHLYKRLRWEAPGPAFLKGGRISRRGLNEVLDGRDREGAALLLRRFPGMDGKPVPAGSPEHLLLRSVTLWVRRRACDPSGYGLVLDYLWRTYLETVNLGILCHGTAMDREALAAELVL